MIINADKIYDSTNKELIDICEDFINNPKSVHEELILILLDEVVRRFIYNYSLGKPKSFNLDKIQAYSNQEFISFCRFCYCNKDKLSIKDFDVLIKEACNRIERLSFKND